MWLFPDHTASLDISAPSEMGVESGGERWCSGADEVVVVVGHCIHKCEAGEGAEGLLWTWTLAQPEYASITMDPHGPTAMWLHMIKTAPDQEDVPIHQGNPGWWLITRWHHSFPSFIEVPCASPPSWSNHQEDFHRTLQGIPLASTREIPGIPPRWWFLRNWWPWCCASRVLANGHSLSLMEPYNIYR